MRALSMSNRKRKDGMSSWIKILEVVVIFYGDEKEKIDGGRRVWRTRDIARYNSLSSFIFLGLSIAIRTRCTKPPSLALLLLCGCTPLPAAQIALKADENHSDFFFLPHFLYTNKTRNCLPVPILLFFYIFYKIYIWHILNWAVTISHLSRLLMTYILFHPFVSDQSDWILAHFLLKDRHQRERTWRTNCDYQGNRHGSRSYFDCFPPSDSKSPTRV